MSCIASSIAGRIRIRHPALRHPGRLDKLATAVRAWPQVEHVEINASTGSALVFYDAGQLSAGAFAQRCEALVATLLPQQRPSANPTATATAPGPAGNSTPARRPVGSRRVRANRMAKRAMLLSLPVSMLLAASGAKRGHVWSGLFFLHALGVHLWVHRRNLIR